MTVFAAVLVAALVLTNLIWLREWRQDQKISFHREQNLLNRIQHPDVFQQALADEPEQFSEPQGPQDEFDLVGTVQTREPDGG